MLKKGKVFTLLLGIVFLLQCTSILAFTDWQNEGYAQERFTEDVTDAQAPTGPANLSFLFKEELIVDLSWEASKDDTGIAGYEVYRDGVMIGSAPDNYFTDSGLDYNRTYSYFIKAVDTAGNISEESNRVSVVTDPREDASPPSAPYGLTYTIQKEDTVLISWIASTDDTKVVGYEVYRDSARVGMTKEISFLDEGLAYGMSYTYVVRAYDAAGNISLESEPLIVSFDKANDPENIEGISGDFIYGDPREYTTNRFIIKYKNDKDGKNLRKMLGNGIASVTGLKGNGNKSLEVVVLKNKTKPDAFISEGVSRKAS